MLGRFLKADQQERPWFIQALDLADYHFNSAYWATESKNLDEAQRQLDPVMELCGRVLNDEHQENEPSPDGAAIVRARRRRSGALSQRIYCLLDKMNLSKKPVPRDLKELPEDVARQVLELADAAVDDVTKGFRTAGSQPDAESEKQLRALAYNGLVTLGYLRLARGQALHAEERDLAIVWHRELDRRDTNGHDRNQIRSKVWGYPLLDLDVKHTTSGVTNGSTSGIDGDNVSKI